MKHPNYAKLTFGIHRHQSERGKRELHRLAAPARQDRARRIAEGKARAEDIIAAAKAEYEK